MRKKVLISILTIALITLIASTALAGNYNGRCLRFFTTDATAEQDLDGSNYGYGPIILVDKCVSCYYTIGGSNYDGNKKACLVNSSLNTSSPYYIYGETGADGEGDGQTLTAYGDGVYHLRNYNYSHYNEYYMHTDGWFQSHYDD